MSKIISNSNIIRWVVVFAVVGVLTATTTSLVLAGDILRLRANLSGPAINGLTPGGHGDYRLLDTNDRRISVEVEDVNLPQGTKLKVVACGSNIGTITVGPPPVRGGDLNLDTRDGDAVPTCQVGDKVKVFNGSNVILSGKFRRD